MKVRTLNVPMLKDIDLYFYVVVTAKPRESSELDKAMMTEMLNQGTAISQITGRQMNPNKIIERFERIYRERGLFQKDIGQMEQELGMGGGSESMGPMARPLGMQNIAKNMKPEKPSVNTAQGQMPSAGGLGI